MGTHRSAAALASIRIGLDWRIGLPAAHPDRVQGDLQMTQFRSHFFSIAIVGLFCLVFAGLPHVIRADDAGAVQIPPAVQQAETAAAALKQKEESARTQAIEAARQLDALKAQLVKLGPEIEALQKALSEVQAQLKTEQTAVAAANAEKQKADEAAAAAAKKAADAAEKAKKAEEAVAAVQQKANAAKSSLDEAMAGIPRLEKTLAEARASAASAHTQWLEQEKQIQKLLVDAGLWVSFTDDIAPLFRERCLACHNSQKAEGGYSMESFAAVIKGGESGPAFDPAQREGSLLCVQIEDGSMPKDDKPLSAQQVALVKKWAKLGGRLEFGVNPHAPLIQVMPRLRQPMPPETYSFPLPVTALAFSPDGKTLVSSGYHELLLWSVDNPALTKRITNIAERVYDAEFSADGTQIAVASGTPGRLGEIKIFQVADGALAADLFVSGDVMIGVGFSPDGTQLAACGSDRMIHVFDLKTKSERLKIEGHADWVMDVAWSPDGKRLISCGRDKTAKIFDAATGSSLLAFNDHTDIVTTVAFLTDGSQAVSAGNDRLLRVWSAADAKEARKISGFGDEIARLAVLPNNEVLTASLDKNLRVHNAGDGSNPRKFDAQPAALFSLAVHPAANLVATGSASGEICLWNLKDGGKPLQRWPAVPPVKPPEPEKSAAPPTKPPEPEKGAPPAEAKPAESKPAG